MASLLPFDLMNILQYLHIYSLWSIVGVRAEFDHLLDFVTQPHPLDPAPRQNDGGVLLVSSVQLGHAGVEVSSDGLCLQAGVVVGDEGSSAEGTRPNQRPRR